MRRPPSHLNPNSSADLANKTWKTPFVRYEVAITNLLRSVPTYTARQPSGTSLGQAQLVLGPQYSVSIKSGRLSQEDCRELPMLPVELVLDEADFNKLMEVKLAVLGLGLERRRLRCRSELMADKLTFLKSLLTIFFGPSMRTQILVNWQQSGRSWRRLLHQVCCSIVDTEQIWVDVSSCSSDPRDWWFELHMTSGLYTRRCESHSKNKLVCRSMSQSMPVEDHAVSRDGQQVATHNNHSSVKESKNFKSKVSPSGGR